MSTATPLVLHPYSEDYCQHDKIEALCELCADAPVRCPFDDHPLVGDDECPFGPHDDRPVRNGARWSALMADIDALVGDSTDPGEA